MGVMLVMLPGVVLISVPTLVPIVVACWPLLTCCLGGRPPFHFAVLFMEVSCAAVPWPSLAGLSLGGEARWWAVVSWSVC